MANSSDENHETVTNKLINDETNRKRSCHEETLPAFEKLLEQVGSEGVYQRRLIRWFMIPFSFLYGLAAVHFILIISTPNHVCHVPGIEKFTNLTLEEWHNMTIPKETGPSGEKQFSQCQMYSISTEAPIYVDHETLETVEMEPGGQSYFSRDSGTKLDCQFGWDYDTSVWKATVVSNFDWVCDQRGVVTKMLTLRMIGAGIGTFAFAVTSDKFGRLPIFYISLFLCVVFGPAMALSPSLIAFAILEFLHALAFYTIYQMPYLIVLEICSPKLRSYVIISSFLSSIFAICLLPLVVWLLPEWKLLVIIFNLPMAIFFFYWEFIPESPRWLLSQDKISQFKENMLLIASKNGRKVSENFDDLILLAQEEEKKKVPFTDILKSYVLLKHLILTCIILSLGYMFYTGISFNLHNMTGNIFINFFILYLFEFPGNIIGSISSEFLGRRISSVLSELLSAAFILAATGFTNKWAVVVLCSVSKMFSGGMILAVYKQVGEMFPTSLRATAYGITGIVGMASTVAVPSLMAYGSSNPLIPYYILFGLSALCAVFCTFLPETLGLPLPQTMREAMSVGKNQPYFSFIYKGNAHQLLKAPKRKSIENSNIELTS